MARTHDAGGLAPMQQVQEMRADRIVVGLHVDAPAAARKVVPIAQHRAQGCQQPIGDVARARATVIAGLGNAAAECRNAGAQTRPWGGLRPAAVRARWSPRRAAPAALSAWPCRPQVPRGSAASRAPADRRSLRTRIRWRCRECRSRGNADRCRFCPTVHSAVLPAVTPDSATDFLGLKAAVWVASSGMVARSVTFPFRRRTTRPVSPRTRDSRGTCTVRRASA